MMMSELPLSRSQNFMIDYGPEIEAELERLQAEIGCCPEIQQQYPARWLALKLLEQDDIIISRIQETDASANLLTEAHKSIQRLKELSGEDLDVIIANQRYAWINTLMHSAVQKPNSGHQYTFSDRIDQIFTHRILGIPIFLVTMWVVFKLAIDVSAPYLDWVDGVIGGPITNWVIAILGLIGAGGTWVESLFVDGIIAGVGGVLVFIPVLMSLYLALAILEDSGYMARAAFVMDRLMNAIGLHGKSFLPMLVGFGCTVPAIYATRTLENERDRILTGLLVPFMSCGARLPVYILFANIFFTDNVGAVVFGLYFTGILTAIALGMILNNTLFKGKERVPLIMEFPPYHLPTLSGVWFYVWKRTGVFVRTASTLIVITSAILWALMSIPVGGYGSFADVEVTESAFATVTGAIAPVLAPLGFGSWEASGALATGFIAKEVVVSTMSQVYEVEETDADAEAEPTTFFEDVGEIITSFISATGDTLKSLPLIVGINLFDEEEEDAPPDLMLAVREGFEASSGGHGALASLAFMVFVLIYTPCMVAIAAERQELGTKWMWFSIFGQLGLAWLMAFVVFQGGKLLGLG